MTLAHNAQPQAEVDVPTARPPSDADNELAALFDKLESEQLDFLDGAGKRIIELSSALLGILFAVMAFGEQFPHAYLKENPWIKVIISVALLAYLAAILTAVYALQPRDYKRYRHNLRQMWVELARIIEFKARWVRWSGLCFGLASAALALLVLVLIWSI